MTWVRNGVSEKTIETRCAAKRLTDEWGCAVSGVLSVTLTSDPPPRSCFSIFLFTSHPIVTKFYTHHLGVSINIFRMFFE